MKKPPTAKGSAAAKLAWETRRRQTAEELPPHALEAEEGALSSVIQAGEAGSQQNVDAMLHQLTTSYFYDHRTRTLFKSLVDMRSENKPIDVPMLLLWLKANKSDGELMTRLEECGGRDYVMKIVKDASPGPLNFTYYLPPLQEYKTRRYCLAKQKRLGELAQATELTPDLVRNELAELLEQSTKLTAGHVPMIRIVTPEQARAYEADPNDFLVGEGLISRGMFVTFGGEPGVGKSRLATTLAVAGARGNSSWLNFPVRTKWRTLVLQSENDAHRLKEECDAIPKQFNDWIKFTDGLSHGMAFDKPEFRRELRRLYDEWPFEMMVVDPWNDVSSEEGQKDYKEALLNIQACFRGAKMPAVVIVAHLRKRGRDDNGKRKSGRELLHELSGSLALGSTSRTVVVVQAASAAMDDSRVICEVAKANNVKPEWFKEYGGPRSAWKRANGAFESVKDFDWNEYDNPGAPQRRGLDEDMILEVFAGEKTLKPAALANRLHDVHDIGKSTTFRAIAPNGYLGHLFERSDKGALTLKKELLPLVNGANGHKANGHARH